MSFSVDTKDELSRIPPGKKCCTLAEIAGFIRMCGSIHLLGGGKVRLVTTTDNPAIARNYKKMIKDYFGVDAGLEVGKASSLRKGNQYFLTLDDRLDGKAEIVLREVGILMLREGLNYLSDGIYDGLIKTKCCRKAYLRGAFLGAGTISDPEKSYHIEFICTTETLAADVKKLMNSFVDINAKIVQRKKSYVVYLKEAEQVGDMLNILGASNQYFIMQEIKVRKEVINMTNRISNCDGANMDKLVNAAQNQIAQIKKIEDKKTLYFLPDKLRAVAELRLEYPEISLAELGSLLDPPLSKSGVNNRLKKISEYAERL